jgi:phosphoribosylformylglycinamidine synthase
LVTMRFIDHASTPTTSYPFNPNGSPQGITGLTSTDGRFSIMMPHPERVIRNVQNTWQRCGDSEDSAWIRMFRNARKYVG